MAAETEREAPAPVSEAKKERKHPGRQTLPADLSRVERVIALHAEQCVCGTAAPNGNVQSLSHFAFFLLRKLLFLSLLLLLSCWHRSKALCDGHDFGQSVHL